ncbi:hypothetical protein Ocin01_12953 [Orchesella cincta]|uniref:Uncharacterized protein n=1 Tax=Orchesella cincta TaxID=48709 RepID=A0A1D2MLC3_ORCCI|nr:hypothetical protein Ocin01_12953 [Orchesella cincta]
MLWFYFLDNFEELYWQTQLLDRIWSKKYSLLYRFFPRWLVLKHPAFIKETSVRKREYQASKPFIPKVKSV